MKSLLMTKTLSRTHPVLWLHIFNPGNLPTMGTVSKNRLMTPVPDWLAVCCEQPVLDIAMINMGLPLKFFLSDCYKLIKNTNNFFQKINTYWNPVSKIIFQRFNKTFIIQYFSTVQYRFQFHNKDLLAEVSQRFETVKVEIKFSTKYSPKSTWCPKSRKQNQILMLVIK